MQDTFYALGTENTLAVYGGNEALAIEQAKARVFEIQRKMSAFDADSEVCKISANAGVKPVKVSREVFTVLREAKRISRLSGGAFDVTVRPLTKLWSVGKDSDNIPDDDKIKAALQLISYQSLSLHRLTKTAFLKYPNQSIDLGGIAKGYAADEVKKILLQFGITSALINLGGNIVTIGLNPDGKPWTVGIQNPLKMRGEYIGTATVKDKTIVTSAVNERFFIKDAERYHHILDPRTGYPANSGLLSVTIISESSLQADALSTAAFVLGLQKGTELVKSQKADAVFICDNGDVFSTFELKNKLEELQ